MLGQWPTETFGELFTIFNGNSIPAKVKKEKYTIDQDGIPYIGTKDVGYDTTISYQTGVVIPPEDFVNFRLAPAHCTFVCAEGGSAGRKIGFTQKEVFFGNKLYAIVPGPKMDSKFTFYFCISDSFKEQFKNRMSGMIGGVNQKKFKTIEIPVPPLEEQQRIVSILDEAFDNISNTTEQVKGKMESSRPLLDSIFNSAFTGILTEKWRRESSSNQTASVLMERILESRRTRSDGKYSEPITPQEEYCHEIPEEWAFATIEQLLRMNSGLSYGILKPGDSDPNGVPMVRVLDIGDGKLSGTEIFMVSEKLANEYKRTRLEEGDIMLAVMATIGRCAIVPPHLSGGNVNRALAVLKLTKEINPKYILYSLLSPQIQTLFQSKKQGAAQARINLGDLRKYCVPIPPLAEQEIIIQLLSDVIDEHELLEQTFRNQLESLSQLKQSILQEAFNGTL
jgi:type I restriction enzyme, S subunit